MANKKRKKRSWLKTLLIYLCLPPLIWLAAFLVWFYWPDLAGESRARKEPARAAARINRNESTPAKRQQEKIFEDERKNLDDIVKQRSR